MFPEIEVEIEEVGGVEEEGKEGAAGQVSDGEDEWADVDSTFVPLTWAKKLPRTYYKGSDPEWQEFRKIAKDQPRQKKVYTELISVIVQGVTAHPMLSRQLGKEPKVGKYWLDVTFPDGPPQEYSRTGIEIGEGFIAIAEQRITEEQYHRNSRLLWPSGTMSSLYAFYKTLWGFQSKKIKDALGIETKAEPGSPEHRANNMLQMLEAQQARKQAGSLSKAQTSPGSETVESGTGASENHGMQSTTPSQPERPPTDARSPAAQDDKLWFLPSVRPGLTSDNKMESVIATTMFAHTLQKNWTPQKMEPPRGTFIVSGLVQMRGTRAAITLDVQAFYDPKSSRFAVVNLSPKTLKKWNQAPRGGP